MKGDRERCLEIGMNDYVSKPIRVAELREAIARHGRKTENSAAPPISPARAPATGASPPSDILNAEEIMGQLGVNLSGYSQFLDIFFEDAESQLEAIAEAIASTDPKKLEYQAHSLKGSAASIGAERVRDAALRLESMGRQKDLNGATDALKRLVDEMNALHEYIERLSAA